MELPGTAGKRDVGKNTYYPASDGGMDERRDEVKDDFFQLQKLLGKRSKGSFGTKKNYNSYAHAFFRRVKDRYPSLRLNQLKLRHFAEDMEQLQANGIDIGQQKNIAIIYRLIAKGIGKSGMVPESNESLGIDRRASHATSNRAVVLTPGQSEEIYKRNWRYGLAAEGALLLGFRAQEASKFDPHYADRGHYVKLRGSWCKGGRERCVDLSSEGRIWLDKAKSLIPTGQSISDRPIENFYRCFLAATQEIAGCTPHDLRHTRAHQIYEERTGLKPPISGGPTLRDMSPVQKHLARTACDYLSEQFGHNRRWVASQYLGKMR